MYVSLEIIYQIRIFWEKMLNLLFLDLEECGKGLKL
jgi:hypothetical protein